MDIQTIPFRKLPLPDGDGLDDQQLRDRVCEGLLVRHATAGPASDRLLAVTREGLLTAPTSALRSVPDAVVALGRAVGEANTVRTVFRTGMVRSSPRGDTLAVLELLDDERWWLATCRPTDDEDQTPRWSERTGHGPLPPSAGWWARRAEPQDADRIGVRATDHLDTDVEIVAAAHATLGSAPPSEAHALARELASTMASLLRRERSLPVVLALRGRRVSAFVLPPTFLGGLDEAIRAIATATGADTIAVLDGAPEEVDEAAESRLTMERAGERTTVLLDSSALDGDGDVVVDVSSLGTRPLAERWVGRAPVSPGVSLLGLRGLHPLPQA